MEYGAEFQQLEEQMMNGVKDDLLEILGKEKEKLEMAKHVNVFVDVHCGRVDMIEEICKKFGAL